MCSFFRGKDLSVTLPTLPFFSGKKGLFAMGLGTAPATLSLSLSFFSLQIIF